MNLNLRIVVARRFCLSSLCWRVELASSPERDVCPFEWGRDKDSLKFA